MADYDFSKPAPDRSHRVPLSSGSGTGGLGFILVGAVVVLILLYAVFGGAGVSTPQDPNAIDAGALTPEAAAPAAPEVTAPATQ